MRLRLRLRLRQAPDQIQALCGRLRLRLRQTPGSRECTGGQDPRLRLRQTPDNMQAPMEAVRKMNMLFLIWTSWTLGFQKVGGDLRRRLLLQSREIRQAKEGLDLRSRPSKVKQMEVDQAQASPPASTRQSPQLPSDITMCQARTSRWIT